MYCEKCGREVKKGEKFCIGCGNPIIQKTSKDNSPKGTKFAYIILPVIAAIGVLTVGILVYNKVIYPKIQYDKAETLLKEGEYQKALEKFDSLGGYKDAKERVEEVKLEIKYKEAEELLAKYEYQAAADQFVELGNYKDAKERLKNFVFQVKTNDAEGISYDYELDEKGNLTRVTRRWEKAQSTKVAEYQYNENNMMIYATITENSGDGTMSEEKHTYEYDSHNNLTMHDIVTGEYAGERTTYKYSYDENDNRIQKIEYGYDDISGYSRVYEEDNYEYDDKGNLISCEEKIDDREYQVKYEYDGEGNMIKETKTGSPPDEYSKEERGIRQYTYENNKEKEYNFYDISNEAEPTEKNLYEYDEKQKIIKWTSQSNLGTENVVYETWTYQLDKYGNPTQIVRVADNGVVQKGNEQDITYQITGYQEKRYQSTDESPEEARRKKANIIYDWHSYVLDTSTGAMNRY